MKSLDLRLYLVTDEACLHRQNLFVAVEEALQAGVTLVQYREKNGLGRVMLEKAKALRELCHRYHVPLIVNDRLDIALLSGADGVHLGQDDIQVAEAKRMTEMFFANCASPFKTESVAVNAVDPAIANERQHSWRPFFIGATAHNVGEALAAEAAGAHYLGCGAVFATTTKRDTVPLGLEGLRAIRQAVHIPIVGIAGITSKNYGQVLATGADGAAVVSAILGAADITAAVKGFLGEGKLKAN